MKESSCKDSLSALKHHSLCSEPGQVIVTDSIQVKQCRRCAEALPQLCEQLFENRTGFKRWDENHRQPSKSALIPGRYCSLIYLGIINKYNHYNESVVSIYCWFSRNDSGTHQEGSKGWGCKTSSYCFQEAFILHDTSC